MRLGRATLEALDALPADTCQCLADISLWEVATLVELGRVELPVSLDTCSTPPPICARCGSYP